MIGESGGGKGPLRRLETFFPDEAVRVWRVKFPAIIALLSGLYARRPVNHEHGYAKLGLSGRAAVCKTLS